MAFISSATHYARLFFASATPVPLQRTEGRRLFSNSGSVSRADDLLFAPPSSALARLASVLLLLASVSGFAQSTASTPGLVPGASFETHTIDTVNIANRNAVVHIPLFSLPQLGQLALSYSINANTTLWREVTSCAGDISQPTTFCTYSYITTTNPLSSSLAIGPSVTQDQGYGVASEDTLAKYIIGYEPIGAGQMPVYGGYVARTYAAIDTLNTLHPLYYDNAAPTQMRSLDGSKLLFKANSSAPYDYQQFAARGTVIDSQGISYTTAGITDTLGNAIIRSVDPQTAAQSLIDSVGRHIPESSGYTASTDGCPDLSSIAAFQPLVGSHQWVVPGPNNGTSTYILCYANVTLHTNFWGNNGQAVHSAQSDRVETIQTVPALQSVVLPDRTAWTFSYDSANPSDSSSFGYGTLNQIGFPQGGSVSYTYVNGVGSPFPVLPPAPVSHWDARYLYSRTESDAKGNSYTWTYTPDWVVNANNTLSERMTVTDPGSNDTVYIFDHGLNTSSVGSQYDVGPERSRISYQGAYSAEKMPLRSIVTTNSFEAPPFYVNTYRGAYSAVASRSTQTAKSLDGTLVASETPEYDVGSFSATAILCSTVPGSPHCSFGSPVSYSLGLSQGSVVTDASGASRSTVKQYLWQTSPQGANYFQANILDPVGTVTVADGSGVQAALTTYGYDENNGSPQGYFGLNTSVTQWLDQGVTSPKSSTVYNAQGMPTSKTDPLLTATAIQDYTCGGLFPQTVVRAYKSLTVAPETTTYAYDCNTGHITGVTDPNGSKATYGYDDPLGRIKLAKQGQ